MLHAVIIAFILILLELNLAYAEQILTTVRSDANNTAFDGKWTFLQEWKSTSEDKVTFDDGTILVIKTGHDYDNLYVLIDFISDTSIQKFADSGIICIDSRMDRGSIPRDDDYCFSVVLGSSRLITLQGGHMFAQTGFWKKIENHPNLIGVGGISDKHDRYSATPHATYEFKIPLEIFERSDRYGFYVGAYDAKTGKEYSWPQNIATEKYPFVPGPEKWGYLISPDKSIPEFDVPLFLLLSITIVIVLSRNKIIRINYNYDNM